RAQAPSEHRLLHAELLEIETRHRCRGTRGLGSPRREYGRESARGSSAAWGSISPASRLANYRNGRRSRCFGEGRLEPTATSYPPNARTVSIAEPVSAMK